jgi:hypothetical protein
MIGIPQGDTGELLDITALHRGGVLSLACGTYHWYADDTSEERLA